MRIILDVSSTSVVVTCTACPHWFAFTWTREDARASGVNHKIAVHDYEPARAIEGDRQKKSRHAEKMLNVGDSPEHSSRGNLRPTRADA